MWNHPPFSGYVVDYRYPLHRYRHIISCASPASGAESPAHSNNGGATATAYGAHGSNSCDNLLESPQKNIISKIEDMSSYYGALSLLRRCGLNSFRNNGHTNNIAAAGISVCLAMSIIKSNSYHCLAEANPQQSPNRRRRKRPPIFGSTIPIITKRGIKTGLGGNITTAVVDVDADRDDCAICKHFSKGPCGEIFKRWLNCTDQYPGKNEGGEPLHLKHCLDLAEELGECLDTHTDDYINSKDNEEDIKQRQQTSMYEKNILQTSWSEFVNEIEDGIKEKKFIATPFPENYNPSMQFKPSTKTGAVIFAPDIHSKTIITSYILDENENLLAAASKEDMDMGSFGCVLQFDVVEGMKVVCRAIYDSDEEEDVTIFTRTMLVPGDRDYTLD